MFRAAAVLALLFATLVNAQGLASGGGLTGGPSPGAVQSSTFQTSATTTLFVDPTGSDTTSCGAATGTAACLTLQGAINRIPKQVRNPVTVVMASGTYAAGAYVDGFMFEPASSVGAYLEIQGTLITATVATGSASGTASSGTAGSGATFGTMTDSTQTWTVNDLRGKLVELTGGTGSTGLNKYRVVDSNTATVITFAGTYTAPDATTTYVIRDWGSVISGDVAFPAINSYTAAATGGASASIIIGSNPRAASRVTVRWMKFTGLGAVCGNSDSLIDVTESRIATTRIFSMFQVGSGGLLLNRNSVAVPASAISVFTPFGGNQLIASTKTLWQGTGTGTIVAPSGTAYANWSFSGDSFRSLTNGLRIDGLNAFVQSSRFDTITGLCISTSGRSVGAELVAMGRLYIVNGDFTSCGTAIESLGNSGVTASAVIAGSSNTTVYKATNGGTIQESATATVTGTTEINVDGITYTVADLRALSPKSIVNLSTLSHVWEP